MGLSLLYNRKTPNLWACCSGLEIGAEREGLLASCFTYGHRTQTVPGAWFRPRRPCLAARMAKACFCFSFSPKQIYRTLYRVRIYFITEKPQIHGHVVPMDLGFGGERGIRTLDEF